MNSDDLTRRTLLELSAAALLASACSSGEPNAAPPTAPDPTPVPRPTPTAVPDGRPPNIVLLVTDQERYFDTWPFPVPGRERLAAMGVRFDNHQIASNVCSPSRSVLYTGRHIQQTGVYDNVSAPWQKSMSTDIATIGTRLRQAGYYTAYKGKFHLAAELEELNEPGAPERLLTDVLEAYGFSDYFGVGDLIGATRGGYLNDEITAATTVRWLREKATALSEQKSPWFLAVNLVNPHDVMYVDTDLPDRPVQGADHPVMDIRRPPDAPLYRATWDHPLPATRHQAFDAEGRPQAHREFQAGRAVMLGTWPDEDRRWRLLQDYYFNCIRDSDRHVVRVISELESLGLLDSTAIVMTSDHGELGGAHQMHGKGPCAYREQNHVPLIVARPGVRGGQRCSALTSHVDVVPTLLALAGADADGVGHSLLTLLDDPGSAEMHAVRTGALFNFNMLSYLDSDFLGRLKALRDARRLGKVKQGVRAARALGPALDKRGAIRSLFDGRYRFSRYFSPREHHLPDSVETLRRRNDLELFDLQADPDELHNLADDAAQADRVASMSAELNALIRAEVGVDDGSGLLLSKLADWDLEGADL